MPAAGATVVMPGVAHPHPPLTLSGLARFTHVDERVVRGWLAAGLPVTADGRIDPFAAANWLSWGHFDECPALARRWRTYLVWFAPFVAGQDRARRLRWERTHGLYLPRIAGRLEWWLPRPSPTSGQTVADEALLSAAGLVTAQADGWWHLSGDLGDEVPVANGMVTVGLSPQTVLTPGDAEHAALVPLVEAVAGTFRYEYRHHVVGEYAAVFAGQAAPVARAGGSCLDCALALAARLAERGRPWRLIAGLVADSRIANPHFWIECEVTGGRWAPLDPSLPAIVRMVGGDWRAAARAWTGALDARRITLGVVGAGLAGVPGGVTVGSLMGEAVIDGARNAWPCIDWVCGDCEAGFSEVT
jgi:hypothetical protein